MLQTIEAIYEDGVFKPLGPVDLPEGTRVRVDPGTGPVEPSAQVREQLLAAGAETHEADRILANLRVLWNSYDSLTSQQQAVLGEAGLDQERFFDHRVPKDWRSPLTTRITSAGSGI